MISRLVVIVAVSLSSIIICSDAFRQASFSRLAVNKKVTALFDINIIHDTGIIHTSIDAFHHIINTVKNTDLHAIHSTFNLADAAVIPEIPTIPPEISIYSKVDKTGFIGACADYIEQAIDLSHTLIQKLGVKDTYGYSIILFTILIKAVTLPLTTSQLESTTKMQKLTPLQKRIQERYADDEVTKNKMLSQLFQAANVNPLAGCFPALIQIPIFISLYRALQNLVAENKLSEPFLWIPDLEGPVYSKPPGESLDWVKSIITGAPNLGWADTLAFLSLPVILYASQSFSSKVMAPPKDPNKILTEQEQFSQSLVNNLPFVIAFFSLNVPAGLAVYWIINNLLTTGINLVVKNQFKDDVMPAEVAQMMAEVDAPVRNKTKKTSSSGNSELRGKNGVVVDTDIVKGSRKELGFGAVLQEIDEEEESSKDSSGSSGEEEEEGDEEEEKEESSAISTKTEEGKKRKKNKINVSSKKGKKRA